MDPVTLAVRSARTAPDLPAGRGLSLRPCARMFALLRGLRESTPFMPAAPWPDRSEVNAP